MSGVRYCTRCGTALTEDQLFCTRCGTQVPPLPPLPGSAGDEQPTTALPAPPVDPPTAALPLPPVYREPDPVYREPEPVYREEVPYLDPPARRSGTAAVVVAVALLLLAGAAGGGLYLLRHDDRASGGATAAPAPTPGGSPMPTPSRGPSPTSSATPSAGPAGALPVTAQVPASAPSGVDDSGAPVTYSAGNLTDGDPGTCWRVRGDASGATIRLTLPSSSVVTAVGLVNGYAKTDPASGADRYAQERRITQVTWTLSGSAQQQVLRDGVRTEQRLTLPAPVTTSVVELRIDTTTPPGAPAFDYTAISSVVVVGAAAR